MVQQAVPYTNEPEYKPLQQCRVRAWVVLLQLAVVLVSGSPRTVVMFNRARGVKEGRQICVSLSGYVAEDKAQHRNIQSNAKPCEIVVKKRLAPGKAACTLSSGSKIKDHVWYADAVAVQRLNVMPCLVSKNHLAAQCVIYVAIRAPTRP